MNVKAIASSWCPPFLRPTFNRIEASPIGLRLARGVFWSMAGAAISRGLMLIAMVSVARMLGKSTYGEFGMIQSTVGMFTAFAGFGLGLTATKHVAELRQSDPSRAGRIIALSGLFAIISGGLMAIFLYFSAPWLAEHTINAPHLAGILRIGALILFISALNGAQTGALSGFEAFKTIAHVNLWIGLISFPILVGGVWIGGLTGGVWALAINLIVNWTLNHLALRKEARLYGIPFTFRNCTREWSVLWKFSLPAVLGGIMVSPAFWASRAMLTNQPNGYGEIGILTAALVFQTLLLFVSSMLNGPLLSMVSNAGSRISDQLSIINILSSWILGVAVAIPLLCFPEVAQALFGKEYDGQNFKVTFSLVVFCTSIMTYKAGLARVLAANSLLWWGFCSNAFWAVMLIFSAAFLVRFGAPGIAAAICIAYILNTVILVPVYYSRNLVPKGTLISLESGLIWSVVIGLVFLNFANVNLIFRSMALVPCLMIVAIAFKRLLKTSPGHVL